MSHDSGILRINFSLALSSEAKALLLHGVLARQESIVVDHHIRSRAPSHKPHPLPETPPKGSYDTDDESPQPAHRPRKKARQEGVDDITEASDHNYDSSSEFVVSNSETSDSDFTATETDMDEDHEGTEAGSTRPNKAVSKSQAMDSSSSDKRKPWVHKSAATMKILRREYRKNKYPTEERKEALAAKFKVDVSQVSTWFVNERSKRGHTGSRGSGPRPKVGGSNGQNAAGSALRNSHPLQDILGVGFEANGHAIPLREADPSVKTEVRDADVQIKTENGFVDVKPRQMDANGEKLAKWEAKRVGADLEVGQAFQKLQKLLSKQAKLQETVTQAKRAIAEHKQRILEAEKRISDAERTSVEIVKELQQAETEHDNKKEKLETIMETLHDLKSQ